MGPGPANAHPRVLAAQTLPLLGHLHPPFVKIMDEIQDGLRYVFQVRRLFSGLSFSPFFCFPFFRPRQKRARFFLFLFLCFLFFSLIASN